MSEQPVKVDPDDEIVILQHWYEIVESPEFNKTVLAWIDKRLAKLESEKRALRSKLQGMDALVAIGNKEERIDELTSLKELFQLKARKYQRKLKGE